jgi:cysteinyl-tRNA synthetase
VYDSSHLGHARTYVAFDIIIRYLRYLGYGVNVIVNITDIDDSIIAAAREAGRDPMEMARAYGREFQEDMRLLGIESFSRYVPASEHVDHIIEQIRTLVGKGFAYETESAVFFDVSRSSVYGSLSWQTNDELSLRRLEPDPQKRNPHDFSVWKKQAAEEDLPAWDSPWGRGRPGWHIEDTAIAMDQLGSSYDVHGGGVELIFPHHDAEIAQAEAMTGETAYVKYWLHTGLLKVDGVKMSKSLGNSLYVRDILKTSEPDALRYFITRSHYRSVVNYNHGQYERATNEFLRIRETIAELRRLKPQLEELSSEEKSAVQQLGDLWSQFLLAMDDDFDTPRAVTFLLGSTQLVSQLLRSPKVSARFVEQSRRHLENAARILGLRTLTPQ